MLPIKPKRFTHTPYESAPSGRAIKCPRCSPVPKSALELAFERGVLGRGGFPPFRYDFGVDLKGFGHIHIDFAEPIRKIAVELDSKAFHKDKAKDMERDLFTAKAGWVTLRFDSNSVRYDPERVYATLMDTVQSRTKDMLQVAEIEYYPLNGGYQELCGLQGPLHNQPPPNVQLDRVIWSDQVQKAIERTTLVAAYKSIEYLKRYAKRHGYAPQHTLPNMQEWVRTQERLVNSLKLNLKFRDLVAYGFKCEICSLPVRPTKRRPKLRLCPTHYALYQRERAREKQRAYRQHLISLVGERE